MGNKIARTTQVSPSEYYLHELPSSYNLVLFEVLCKGRFFKSILCRHDEGLVLVKVYFKRGDTLDFQEYERRLKEIRHIFQNIQHRHLWPFQFWLETDKAVYLLRQYFFSNLHDRLSTRPFLSLIEKKWLAFQLLCAVKQSHDNGICHGDIKCENVLVSSWNWVYLADFASFKPTYIPDDDPSDFSFFFDTGGRRRCYLAPERFYEHGGEMQVQPDAPLKSSMDIFSLGCVIAELFLEGQPLFELSQLLAYRRGQFDPRAFLDKIPVAGISKMIAHMIQLNPEERLSCESYLQEYGSVVFPDYFTPFLHKFFSCLIPADPDARVAMTQGAFQELHKQIVTNKSCEDVLSKTDGFCEQMESLTKQRTDTVNGFVWNKCDTGEGVTSVQLIGEISSLLKNAGKRESIKSTYENACCKANNAILTSDAKHPRQQSFNQLLPLCKGYSQKEYYHLKRILKCDLKSFMDKYNTQPDALLLSFFPRDRCTLQCEGMVLIASLLCSFMRSVKQPHLRRSSLLLLMSSSLHIDDENLLQLVIPFIIVMLSDPSAIVRCAALEALCNILPLVQEFPPSDAKIFPEYILPMLSTLPDDPEESVRVCYASNISKIALTAYRFLVCSNLLSDFGIVEKQTSSTKELLPAIETPENMQIVNIDAELTKLRKSMAEIIQELVMGPKNTKNIRRALLQDIGHLCFFFGQSMSSDFILPILPAFLNDRDDQLRADFYGQIVFVCFFVGQISIELYLLPYIEQGLSDDMEVVIVNALECLTMLCNSKLLRKRILLDMIERAFPLLCYPLLCVRRAAVSFIAISSGNLGLVDSNIYLYPLLHPFLQRKPNTLSSEVALLASLKPPVSKDEYYRVRENARGSDMLDRQRKIWYKTGNSNQWEAIGCESKDYSSKEPVSSGTTQNTLHNTDYTARSRTIGSKLFNNPSTIDNKDSFSPEKMHFPGFMSAHITSGNSLFHDKPSEGMPLYSFSMNKHSIVSGAANSDVLLQWNTLVNSSISSPSLDRVSKSFLSTSDQPKLISGSIYNISNASMKTPSSLQKLETCENDQSSYISSKFRELSVSDALKSSSAASVDDISLQSDVSGLASPMTASCDMDARWRPRGVLVAHLQEHRSAVNDIAVSNDNSFFVTASDDSSVKLWDTRKLERDISFRSKLTYNLDGMKAFCTTILTVNAQVVVGASDGQVHLFSIDYISRGGGSAVEKYSGIADIKKKQIGEGAILSLLNCPTGDGFFSHTILFSTQLCGIHLWDTRADSIAWRFKATPDEGYVSSLVMGKCGNWFVSGTSRGVLTLWDRRFLLPLNSWQCSRFCPVEKICLFIPSENNASSAMGKPLVYVAAGFNEISLWNAENGRCHQVFKYAGCVGDAEISSNFPWALTIPANKSSSKHSLKNDCTPNYRTDELNEPPPHLSGVRSLFPFPGGDFLSGGTDLKIRYWDHNSPGRSFCVCGPSTKGIAPKDVYDTQTTFGVQVVQETNRRSAAARPTQKAMLALAATDSAGCHCDSVLSLASLKWNQRLLISGSRDGAVKVWR